MLLLFLSQSKGEIELGGSLMPEELMCIHANHGILHLRRIVFDEG